jgi:hypothetical protein
MNASVCVRDFRRRWKPQKERLLTNGNGQGTLIRFHRACSWLARVEAMTECEDADLALVSLWIAFNSLYGQWDRTKREPKPDRECWRAFVDRMLLLDCDNQIVSTLQEHKRLVISLLEDEYLNNKFWRDPRRSAHAKNMKHVAQSWYVMEQWTTIIDELLDRIYLMRCQLVHGAATYGGQLTARTEHSASTTISVSGWSAPWQSAARITFSWAATMAARLQRLCIASWPAPRRIRSSRLRTCGTF